MSNNIPQHDDSLLRWKPEPDNSHPKSTPWDPITWPSGQHQSNQIQQIKGTSKAQSPQPTPSTQPSVPTVPARTTPRKVSGVRVVLQAAGTGQKKVVVQFAHPSGDPYFTGANVYLKKANGQPVLVTGGKASPLTFTIARNASPHSLFVTSVGNQGETEILSSPSAPVHLS